MANKKQPVVKPDPLVIYAFDSRALYDSSLCTQLRDKQNGVSVDVHMALVGQADQKIRELVAGLFANQHVLIMRLIDLLEIVEDPSVAHAIHVKDKLDMLTQKVEELKDDLSSHVRTFNHEYSNDY